MILPSGEMLLVMFQPVTNSNGTYQENMIMYRSEDGGQTWGTRDTLPLLGREPYFTLLSDGTLFITASVTSADYRNAEGYRYAVVYRSQDGAATWTRMPILSGSVPNVPPGTVMVTSHNLVQLFLRHTRIGRRGWNQRGLLVALSGRRSDLGQFATSPGACGL